VSRPLFTSILENTLSRVGPLIASAKHYVIHYGDKNRSAGWSRFARDSTMYRYQIHLLIPRITRTLRPILPLLPPPRRAKVSLVLAPINNVIAEDRNFILAFLVPDAAFRPYSFSSEHPQLSERVPPTNPFQTYHQLKYPVRHFQRGRLMDFAPPHAQC